MCTEIWKDISGYEGLYQVSNFGRVKRFYKTTPPRILKPGIRRGYSFVELSCSNEGEQRQIHRLVAQAFIPNPESKPQINHIDGCKTNNRIENLEWVTAAENMQHAFATGLMAGQRGEDNPKANLTDEQARFIRDNPDSLACTVLAEIFGVSKSTISDVQIGKTYKNVGGEIREPRPQPKRVPDNIREQIRREFVAGSHEFGCCGLARKYGVCPATILNIVKEGDANDIQLRPDEN